MMTMMKMMKVSEINKIQTYLNQSRLGGGIIAGVMRVYITQDKRSCHRHALWLWPIRRTANSTSSDISHSCCDQHSQRIERHASGAQQ